MARRLKQSKAARAARARYRRNKAKGTVRKHAKGRKKGRKGGGMGLGILASIGIPMLIDAIRGK